MEIDKNSLHYRLYHVYGSGSMTDLEYELVNFCQYSRKVMIGILMTAVVVLIGVELGLGLLEAFGSLGLWLFTDNPFILLLPIIGKGGLAALGDLALAAIFIELALLLFYISTAIKNGLNYGLTCFRVSNPKEKKEPGFIKTWYMSWKEKYCPTVTLEKD